MRPGRLGVSEKNALFRVGVVRHLAHPRLEGSRHARQCSRHLAHGRHRFTRVRVLRRGRLRAGRTKWRAVGAGELHVTAAGRKSALSPTLTGRPRSAACSDELLVHLLDSYVPVIAFATSGRGVNGVSHEAISCARDSPPNAHDAPCRRRASEFNTKPKGPRTVSQRRE